MNAQIAGLNTLSLFDISTQGRTSGMGFDYLALYDADATLAVDNPSLLHSAMGHTGLFSIATLFDGGSMGSLAYVHDFKHVGPLVFAFRWNNYGRFQGYDETETPQGEFSAADYALSVGWGMWIDSNFSIGACLKPVLSQYEHYKALALAIDLAASAAANTITIPATARRRSIWESMPPRTRSSSTPSPRVSTCCM